MRRLTTLLLVACLLLAVAGSTAAAGPRSIPSREPREAVYRGVGEGYRINMQLYGHLLKAHVTGLMLCARSDEGIFHKHFKLRFEKEYLGVGGPTGRFSYTSRPLARGWTAYGVDEALIGHLGPARVLPGFFGGSFEYVVRRPRFRCRTDFRGSTEVPFRVERVATELPRR
jgi:hypothetical protein